MRRHSIWELYKDYFPSGYRQEVALSPEKKYIFGIHPHGIFCAGAWLNFVHDRVSMKNHELKVHIVTLSLNFRIPIWRDFLLSLGFISASSESIMAALKVGKSVMIAVGGAAEAMDCHPGVYDLTLDKREGFIKLALRSGASLVPVLSFGETDLYYQVANPCGSRLRNLQELILKNFGFTTPLIRGRGLIDWPVTWGLLPLQKPIMTVCGTPIDVPQLDEPTGAQIKKYHELYKKGLLEIFDKYKDVFAKDRKSDLKIVR